MRTCVIAVLAALALGSCASLSEDACRRGNWTGIGLADGAAGRLESYVGRHAEACAEVGVTPDVTAWRAGRQQGLALYCTSENAYDLGRRGAGLAPVCGGDVSALAAANRQGRVQYQIEREIDRLEGENRDLAWRIEALRDGKTTPEERRLIRAWRADMRWNALRAQSLALERLTYGWPR